MNLRIVVPLAAALLANSVHAESKPQTVSTKQGMVVGVKVNGVSRFLGIPYAKAPTGDARWSPPSAAKPWLDKPKGAVTFGASCIQALHDKPMMAWTMEYLTPPAYGVSEDCLSLNVWARSKNMAVAKLPVLVYIHGGGFTEGSASVPIYDGTKLARRGIVVVTLNYRLGPLGFLAHPQLSKEQAGSSGNYAIEDQIAALRWVRENIGNFGGDPAKVTLAGQSAGAWSVMALLVSPEAKGLFRSAIVMSTPDLGSYPSLQAGEAAGEALFSRWGVEDLKRARALPASALSGGNSWGNIIADGRVLPKDVSPLKLASDVPLLMGYTLNDLFAPSPRFTAVEWRQDANARYGANTEQFLKYYPGHTDMEATISAAREAGDRFEFLPIAKWLEARDAKSPVFVYRFSHVEPGPNSDQYGAFHTSELPYMFDTLDVSPKRAFTPVDRHVVAQFSGAMELFIKNGDPNGGSVPHWPAMTINGKQLMEFGDTANESRIFPDGADEIISQGKPPAHTKPH
jgi:para-nitrobenzyl esterase